MQTVFIQGVHKNMVGCWMSVI